MHTLKELLGAITAHRGLWRTRQRQGKVFGNDFNTEPKEVHPMTVIILGCISKVQVTFCFSFWNGLPALGFH